MENWGLVLYDERLLVIDEQRTSAASKQLDAVVIVHELAHQWFGNLVTMYVTPFLLYQRWFFCLFVAALYLLGRLKSVTS